MRQCERTKTASASIRASTIRFQKKKKRLTSEQLADLKSKSQCKRCNEWDHWRGDHNPDGSLKPGVKSSKSPLESVKRQSCSISPQKKSVTFHVAKLSSFNMDFCDSNVPGPLLDGATPYSGIGIEELNLLSSYLKRKWNGKVRPIPDSISDKTHWRYGIGTHSSDSRKMLGSVVLSAYLEDGTEVNINHVVIEGSSQ